MDPNKPSVSCLFFLLSLSLSLLSTVVFATPSSPDLEDLVEDEISLFLPNCPQNPSFIAATQIPQVCKDDSADLITFTTTESGSSQFAYMLTDVTDTVISILSQSTFDFNSLDAADYHVYGIAYEGVLSAVAGMHIEQVSASTCHIRSSNFITVQVIQLYANIDIISDYHGYPISRAGESDGELKVTPSGGLGAYAYHWNTQPPQTEHRATGLVAGTYEVTVSDEGGCVAKEQIELIEPEILELAVGPMISYNPTYQLRCADGLDGTLAATPTGGVAPYTYSWTGISSADSFLLNLPPGTFEVIVTDANGAQASGLAELNSPAPIQAESELFSPSCYGQNDGKISLNISGGIAPYDVKWETGDSLWTILNLEADVYAVVITDSLGCQQSISIELTAPDTLEVSYLAENPSCAGQADGWIALDPTGGTSPYQINWTYGSDEANIFDLTGGKYSAQIVDRLGCIAWVEVELEEPIGLEIDTEVIADNGTSNGSISIEVLQGTAPFTFAWTHGDSTASIQNISIGTYDVVITDVHGCTLSQSIEVPTTDKLDCLEIHMGFTPNGDGVNETWYIPCIEWFPENEVIIYNRWGQIIFQATSYQNDWDGSVNGRPLPDGTYFYTLQLNSVDDKRLLKGTISILR